MNIVPIAFAFDNNLILPACVCISSLLMNAKEDTFYDIYILQSESNELNHKEIDKLPFYYSNCRIQYRTVGNIFDEAFEIRGITTPTYYRLLIPELIPEYEKVFYADVDIIFRTDLSQLYKVELSDCYIAACLDMGINYSVDGARYIDSMPELVLGKYIQAGFILMNNKKMRLHNVVQEFKCQVRNKYKFQDQDILNIVCKDRITILPWYYNMTTSTCYCLEKEPRKLDLIDSSVCDENRGNIHYNGQKPWKGYCINFDIWWEYYRKSPFFDGTYYFDFFHEKLDEYDRLPLFKRVKILLRYFLFKK